MTSILSRTWILISLALALIASHPRAVHADAAADRAAVVEVFTRLSALADALARTGEQSGDRAVRKRFAPAARDLADDLTAIARRAAKNATYEAIARDALDASRDAAKLGDLADDAEDKRERKALRAQASTIEQALGAAHKAIEAVAAHRDDEARPAGPVAMSPQGFATLVDAVRHADFDRGKTKVVQDAAQHNYFTSAQVASLIALFDFDGGRVDGAAACWSHIVDLENAFVIYQKFDFDSGRDQLRRRVGGH